MAERPEKDLHEDMIRGMIRTLEEEGYDVTQADINSYQQPDKIGEHRPDIIVEGQGSSRTVVEVETCKTVDLDHTKKQSKDFSSSQAKFFVDVPESCLDDLKENARNWGTPVDKWFYREGY